MRWEDDDRQYRVRLARGVARQLVTKHRLSIPIDVEGFCRKVAGIEIYFEEGIDERVSAVLRRDLGAILVNANKPRVHTRFSIAHELGHWYLHSDSAVMGERTVPLAVINEALDVEANAFAAEFLMPATAVRELVRVGVADLPALAARFEVSQEAMWYRLNELRLARSVRPSARGNGGSPGFVT
ncbi:MAG: ImmA/IrrE family metallo-endopeptidase [Bacillota bacterium]